MDASGTPSAERSPDLDRLLTFIDAIVAIAITLLVLPLADLAADVGADQSVWDTVRDHGGQFGAFVLSFVVIARLWLAQHRQVRWAVRMSRDVSFWLIGWTLTIVFLPFPTALLADTGQQAATKVFYVGTLTLSAALLALLAASVRRQVPDGAEHPKVRPAVTLAVLFALSLAVCLLLPGLSYYPLFLLTLDGPIERLLDRRSARQPGRA